ncbi:MAG: YbhB/YbcL family Raf kinase inhibitor-like protein [Bacteroidetes bacterium]|nr:YbhB/YbcL family Raf kinase inhibitor-like protein [Bacteroidota bacterium]
MQKTIFRKGIAKTVFYENLVVRSPAFLAGGFIPKSYTCDGENINPPLQIEDCPPEAQSLAIIVEDPDAPVGTWSHWVVWNIPVTTRIRSNHPHGEAGRNDFQRNRYDGPCPHQGRHHYHFKVYALDCLLTLGSQTKQPDLERAMGGHILAFGELIGIYQRE